MRKICFCLGGLLFAVTGNCQDNFYQEGLASFYADKFEGRITASGEKYAHDKLTAAHLTLPFETAIKVTNIENGKSVIVRINDRGPFIKDRIIDVSKLAAEELGFIETGLVKVKIEVIEQNSKKPEISEKELPFNPEPGMREKPVIQVSQNPYYSFDINQINPDGYGIQIGSYKEMINLARLSEEVKSIYKKDVIVQVTNLKGEKIYRIFLGTFTTRDEANTFKIKLAKKFPDCFVVKF